MVIPIDIKGDDDFVKKTNAALELLNRKALTHYVYVLKYIKIIEAVPEGSGMMVWEKPPRFVVGKKTYEADPI